MICVDFFSYFDESRRVCMIEFLFVRFLELMSLLEKAEESSGMKVRWELPKFPFDWKGTLTSVLNFLFLILVVFSPSIY